MWIGFEIIQNNLGFQIETLILIVLLLGDLIFYAKDFKVGLMLTMFTMGTAFVGFYAAGMNYVPALVCFFSCVALLCLNLYAVSSASAKGGII